MSFNFRKKAMSPKPVSEQAGQGTKDNVGPYLKMHDGPHATKKRSDLAQRLYIMIIGITLTLNVIQAIAILQLLPLYRVVPYFVTFSDKAEQVVRVEPPTGNLSSLEILTESNIREYVTLRNTISNDPQRTIDIWGGKIKIMSTSDVYNDFLNETKPIYDSLMERKFTRSVKITAVLRTGQSSYQVEFEVTDRRSGEPLTSAKEEKIAFIANLRVANIPQNISYQNRFLNPLGFTVGAYSVATKR